MCITLVIYQESSSSVGATTLGGFWPALRFRSTVFCLYSSLSSSSLLSSLNPLLLGPAISILVFLLVLMNMVPIQLIFLTVLVVSFLITCASSPPKIYSRCFKCVRYFDLSLPSTLISLFLTFVSWSDESG